MKLGEIKLQALSLIYPDLAIEYDEESLSDKVYELKSSPSFAPYLIASVGAVNRAFAQIEGRLLSGTDTVTFDLTKDNLKNNRISIEGYNDILRITEVKINGNSVPFEVVKGKIKVDFSAYGVCELTYFKKIKRISHLTGSDYEIDLNGLEAMLPYYIKWELLCSDNRDEAENARAIFENSLDSFESVEATALSETAYSLRRI